MMRSDGWARLLCAWLVGSAVLWGAGCKKEQPQASAVPDAGGGARVQAGVPDAKPAAKEVKPLKFSGVTLKRTTPYTVDVTYTLTNVGTAQARGSSCLALLDEKGFVIHEGPLGSITVKGGTDDVFVDRAYVVEASWKEALTVLLYTARENHCLDDAFQAASEPLRLRPTGSPSSGDAPAPRRPGKPQPGELVLSDVDLRKSGEDNAYRLQYTVKNVSARRINADACFQGYGPDEDVSEDRASVLANPLRILSLAAGATETFTSTVDLVDAQRWDEVVALDVFLDARGCKTKPVAAPARVRFDMPKVVPVLGEETTGEDEGDSDEDAAELDAPAAPDEEATGMDSSDVYDPEEEFPPEPTPPDDEETPD
ncbi:hypothetical protein JYK02_07925 [Corallococcus macrosporus]|uniref:Lipoprotein n=1 Tax=Corallococcus macrosporus TaxID=35 RepID=A0ABS3D6Z2_9BACT|nr:hypothetical protein [Corallococcus macrosporus]MBN8227433.1 hypothetical protein [Corallococcus macrosporus]